MGKIIKYNIDRFLEAQNNSYAGFEQALKEIKSGKKTSHWIWYICPQLRGLGHSYMSNYYGIQNREEAKQYLNNSILKDRLIQIAEAILNNENTVYEIFGNDSIKVKSCFTLFNSVEPIPELSKVIKYYGWL